MCLHILPFQMV
ncbi:hypothetical protein LINPERPRIM_LOCUS25439 [Linum perenne]